MALDLWTMHLTAFTLMYPVLLFQSLKPDGNKKQSDKKLQQSNVQAALYNKSDKTIVEKVAKVEESPKEAFIATMPKGLIGMHSTTQDGRPICFNYNLAKCSKAHCPCAYV